jgi:hypothetical protein
VGSRPEFPEFTPDAEDTDTELAITRPATTKAGITVVDSNWILMWRTIEPPDYDFIYRIPFQEIKWQMQIAGSNQASSHNCESHLQEVVSTIV